MADIDRDNVIVSLTSGTTALVEPRERGADTEAGRSATTSGLIYTEASDMPSLEQLLAEHRIATAVIERGTPAVVPPLRVVIATTLAATVTAIGAVLLVVDVAGVSHPNPYVSLLLVLGGLGLFATILTALTRP
jgi:hypothetical protein